MKCVFSLSHVSFYLHISSIDIKFTCSVQVFVSLADLESFRVLSRSKQLKPTHNRERIVMIFVIERRVRSVPLSTHNQSLATQFIGPSVETPDAPISKTRHSSDLPSIPPFLEVPLAKGATKSSPRFCNVDFWTHSRFWPKNGKELAKRAPEMVDCVDLIGPIYVSLTCQG